MLGPRDLSEPPDGERGGAGGLMGERGGVVEVVLLEENFLGRDGIYILSDGDGSSSRLSGGTLLILGRIRSSGELV